MKKTIAGFSFILLIATAEMIAQTNQSRDLAELDLEQLMRVRVTSVSKHPESRFDAGAAIYVVSSEELRRNGFTTIADSLRTVPGMNVGQVNSHTWAVSARGFNGEYATKLLVLNDGRSVYSPISSGVFWDTQDMMMEDLERIEVIRGPGATLWGANAVNGVVNIISKNAKDTQGYLISSGGGTEERGFGGARYGGQFGKDAYYRVYAKYNNHDDSVFSDGSDAGDSWWMARTGFRMDWEPPGEDLFTLQGDLYGGEENSLYVLPSATIPFANTVSPNDQVSGANVLGRWTRTFSDDSELKVQTYYDHTERESSLPNERRDTVDVELQHSFTLPALNHIVWGLGYRVTSDQLQGGYSQTFAVTERTLNLFSSFIQDEIKLVENKLHFTLGTKLEHNDFTGFEFQPSGRLVWMPTEKQTFWGAISRAVRTPSRAEDDVRINLATQPASASVFTILGDRSGVSEELLAYELGYRVLPHPRLSFDVATFYNTYEDLRSLEPGLPASSPPAALVTFYSANKLKGETYGVEAAGEWQALDTWRLRMAYTFLNVSLHTTGGGTDQITEQFFENTAPRHQFALRSMVDVTKHLEFDCGLRFVDSLDNPKIPAYVTVDIRIGWRPTDRLEVSVAGLNLLDNQHSEFAPQIINTPIREVERSVYGKITWRF